MTICAITPERDPDRMLRPFAELLTDLQNHLRKESRSPVLFDLHLYNRAEDTMDALEGSAHVAWTDAAIYVNARRKGLQLEPVARELYQTGTNLVGLIVTSPESGITNLSSLKGRSFVFGDKGSAVGWYLPRTALVESGLTSSDLSHTDCPIAGVTRLIRSRTYDAGVVLVADFTKLMEAGGRLRVLAELRCPGHPWVFTGNPDATLVNHFRSGLISMRNSSALGRLGSQVVGFVPAKASEYDELEKKIEKAKRFDKP